MLLLLSMHSVHDHCMLVARPDMMHTHMGHVGFVANTSRHSLYATLVTSDDRTDTEKMSMATYKPHVFFVGQSGQGSKDK